jgi:hypothetical protein
LVIKSNGAFLKQTRVAEQFQCCDKMKDLHEHLITYSL